ncbi:MAG: YybH family protein [Candidatus Acidiferrales bacterium]
MPILLIAAASAVTFPAPAKKQSPPPKAQAAAQTRSGTAQTRDAAAQAEAVQTEEIKRLIAEYAKSINDADTTLASRIWWNSAEVSFIHPLGHEHGFEQIKENVYKRLMGETFAERKLTPRDISIHVYGDAAWSEFYWDFNAKFRKNGQPITTHGCETQIYRKFPNGWRIIHVHYSGMPITQPNQGF